MMMCVQMNKKEEFDRIWKWARTYMYMTEGENAGYFAWSCGTDGTRNADGPAPDGEEFFSMALFFASHRWGDGEGIFAYSEEAKKLLHTCIHKGENGEPGRAMWDSKNYLIRFITEVDFSDPSYHLPHFYELFAQWSFEEDRSFWKKAAKASRDYLKKACHPVTGLCAEYAGMMEPPIQKGRISGGDMTGITVMPIVRLLILLWIMSGLEQMSGKWKREDVFWNFSVRQQERNIRMGFLPLMVR